MVKLWQQSGKTSQLTIQTEEWQNLGREVQGNNHR